MEDCGGCHLKVDRAIHPIQARFRAYSGVCAVQRVPKCQKDAHHGERTSGVLRINEVGPDDGLEVPSAAAQFLTLW